MTAPARTRATVSRGSTAERPSESKTAKPRARASTRSRSAAAERAYARREERKSAREAPERSRGQAQALQARPARPKAKQVKVTTTRVPLVVAGMSMLGVGLVATLWLSIATVGGSYEIQRSEGDITTLSEQKKDLIRQNSTMDATPALLNRALKQGLVPGPVPAHVVKHPDGSTTVVGEPTQAPEAPPTQRQDEPDRPVEAR